VVVVSYSGKEINAKLVYYGAGLSGKTTNLEAIYEAVPETSRGKMVSMKTQSDRTLFFDLLPLELGEILGFKTRFLLYTVPGQVFYNATRKLVLKGADAIVFVADSEVGKMEENKESLANLRANLAEYKVNLDDLPWVIQYNKRDLPNVYSLEELNGELNLGGKVPFFEAVATQGKGVFETFRAVSHLLMEKVTRDLRRSSAAAPRGRGVNIEETTPGGPRPTAAPTAAPMSLSQAMASEAQRAAPASAMWQAPAGPVDYGREIELPGEVPAAAAPARPHAPEPEPISIPEPVAPSAAARALRKDAVPVPEPAAPRPRAVAVREVAPVRRNEEPEMAPELEPMREELAHEPRPPARAVSIREQVVPVRLKPGETLREVSIRIVIASEE
jgi:signal recognition particle receptor subunit beta